MESPLSLFRMHWDHELPGGCSAGVLACECTGRPARCSCGRRDAAATRSRDGCATRFMESLRMRPRSSSPFAPAAHPFGNLRAEPAHSEGSLLVRELLIQAARCLELHSDVVSLRVHTIAAIQVRFEPVNLVIYVNALTNKAQAPHQDAEPSLWDKVKRLF